MSLTVKQKAAIERIKSTEAELTALSKEISKLENQLDKLQTVDIKREEKIHTIKAQLSDLYDKYDEYDGDDRDREAGRAIEAFVKQELGVDVEVSVGY